jgi:DNA modification methylase
MKLPIGELKPATYNPRKISNKELDKLVQSIEEFGFLEPVVINKDKTIIGGHQRVKAAEKLKIKEVPVIQVDLDKGKEKALNLALNRISGEFDEEMLTALLETLNDEDKVLSGFDEEEIAKALNELNSVEEDDYNAEPPKEPKSQYGQVYALGEHRLMCGDATKKEDVEKLMEGQKADLLHTDPPYGIKRSEGFEGFGGFDTPIKRRRYDGDKWDEERPPKECFEIALSVSNKAVIWGGNFFADFLPQGKHWLVWDKKNTMPTFGDAELAWTNIKRDSVKIKEFIYNGLIGKERERFHPTQKPLALISEVTSDYSEQGHIVLDLFGGSGSTIIACEQTNRKCYMMELDPKYVDVIIDRWEKFTGNKAELLN